jgi:magnesium-transporting ATPase (P-type)
MELAAEMSHRFAVMLWAAAVLAGVAGLPQLAIAIVVVIVVNGLFAWLQRSRAERAAARLGALMPSLVTVRRDGCIDAVPAADIVPGDVVLLAAGDRVPADVELVAASGCSVDESMLTGESVPVPKGAGDPAAGGTFLVTGEAEGLVTATGSATRLAEIALLATKAKPPPSPLTRELDRIVRWVSMLSVGVGLAFFVVAWLVGTRWTDAFLFAIGVTVALVPEGLLPTVTLSLAMSAQRMARRHALVRNLEAVETLGSATFICTDKTGTLTQNRMSAVRVWTPVGPVALEGIGYEPHGRVDGSPETVAAARTLAAAARAAGQGSIIRRGDHWDAAGDPMEAAIDALARRLGGGDTGAEVRVRLAFDATRMRESALTSTQLCVKGAPEHVLEICTAFGPDRPVVAGPASAGLDSGSRSIRTRAHAAVAGAVEDLASDGLRVLAVAGRELSEAERDAIAEGSPVEPLAMERGLRLYGLIGLHDPPRPSVPAAMQTARQAGIKVAMLTGDHPSTAAAIAREIGLAPEGGQVLDGQRLPTDLQVLGAMLDRDGVVVSRVTPEQKLAVAEALQLRGHVVAMTGDGVNDAPALEKADIGVAMGRSGTDVARSAADLVLLDDDFATIMVAVEQGRAAYANVRRFLTYHLTDNVAELTPFVVWALSGGSFPLALGVLQILCLDIGTDLLPALALGSERPSRSVLKRPPERRHIMDRLLFLRAFAVLGPVEAAFEMAAFCAVLAAAGWRPGGPLPSSSVLAASGAAFTTVVLAQLANAFVCRSSSQAPWELGWTTNRFLLVAVAVELVMLAGFLLVGPVAEVLGHEPPPPVGLLLAVLAMPAVVAADAVRRHLVTTSR